jgi:hypothetical protein
MSEHVTLKIDQAALDQLHQGLAMGVHALAEAVVVAAEARKPKASVARVVVMLEGRVLEGDSAGITGAAGHQIAAFAMFGAPAAYEEFGTPAHDIVAKQKVLKLGDQGFAEKVHHPGAKPRPFINPALITAAAAAEGHIRRGVARKYR